MSVLLVDNGSANIDEIRDLSDEFSNVELIENSSNLGVAAALNIASRFGLDRGFEWLLSLDQDSICPPDYSNAMLRILARHSGVAVLAPTIVDREVGVIGHNPLRECQDVRTCITSGAITSLFVWDAVGGYDEYMFIDSVDFDFCYRVRIAGFRVCQTANVELSHRLGNTCRRRFLLWRVNIPNYSASRCYYRARNEIYYPRKHSRHLLTARGVVRNIKSLLIVGLYESNKREKMTEIIRGCSDGFSSHLLQ